MRADDDLEALVIRERMAAEHQDTVECLQAEITRLEGEVETLTVELAKANRQRRRLMRACKEIAKRHKGPRAYLNRTLKAMP